MKGYFVYGFAPEDVKYNMRELELPHIVDTLETAIRKGQNVYFLPGMNQDMEDIHSDFAHLYPEFHVIAVPLTRRGVTAISTKLQVVMAKRRCIGDMVDDVEVIEELGELSFTSQYPNMERFFAGENPYPLLEADGSGRDDDLTLIGMTEDEFIEVLKKEIRVTRYVHPVLRQQE